VEVLHGGLAECIITMPGTVLMHMTGWSSPICAARKTERKIAHGKVLQGYATAQSHVTSITHAIRPLWYPLSIKGGPGHGEKGKQAKRGGRAVEH
jgi:hypothetical protein